MKTENLSTLKIHKLTQEQYDRELANGNIDENALYLTPDYGSSGGEVSPELINKVDTLESNVASLQTSVNTNTENINTNTEAIALNKKSIEDNKTEVDGKIATVEQSLATQGNEIEVVKGDLTSHTTSSNAQFALVRKEFATQDAETLKTAKEYSDANKNSAIGEAKAYTDQEIEKLVTDTEFEGVLSTIQDIQNAMATDEELAQALETANGKKVDKGVKGSATQPIYFDDNGAQPIAYTIEKSVPADAKFTDTTYTLIKDATNKKIQLMSGDKLVGEVDDNNTTYTIDGNLSTTSTNPIQNKVVTENINNLQEDIDANASEIEEINSKDLFETKHEEGNAIAVSDSAEAPFVGMKLYGKTTQDGTPTPTSPIELKSVGDSGSYSVDLYGKNFADIINGTKGSSGNSNTYDETTHTITLNADDDNGSTGRYFYPFRNFEIGKNYTLSFDIKGTAGKNVRCGWDRNWKIITLTNQFVRYSMTIKANKNAEPIIFYSAKTADGGLASGEYMQFANVQIEEGTEATPYEPYKAKQSITFTDTLRGVGDIKDEVDFARGVKTQRMGFVKISDVITGEVITLANGNKGVVVRAPNKRNSDRNALMCTNAKHELRPFTNADGTFYENPGNFVFCGNSTDTYTTLKTKYGEGYLLYELKTPIETPLSETELNAYRQLMTNKPTTTILSEADMEVDYVVNSTSAEYIENRLEEVKDKIPTKTSQLTNDSSFVNQNGLDNALEDKLSFDEEVVNSESSVIKIVPEGSGKYAAINKVGGMSYKAKNKFYYSFSTQTKNGITFTVNSDKSITISGTATEEAVVFLSYNISHILVKGKTYNIFDMGCKLTKTDGSTAYAYQFTYDDTISQIGVYLQVASGATVNTTKYPMILEATETNTNYEPYYSGLRNAYVTEIHSIASKNLCNPETFNSMTGNGAANTYDATTHTITLNANDTLGFTGRYCTPYSNLEVGKNYTISFDIRGTAGKSVHCGWNRKRADIILTNQFTRYSSTITVNQKAEPIVFYTHPTANGGLAAGDYMQFANVQIEKSSTATEYEPYKEDTFTIPTGAKGVCYGMGINENCYNYIDFERKVYRQNCVKVDLGSLDWTLKGSSYWQTDSLKGLIKPAKDNYTIPNILAENYNNAKWQWGTQRNCIAVEHTGAVACENLSTTEKPTGYLIYELATPIETDISDYIQDNFIEVAAGGVITAVNEYNYNVPTEIDFYTSENPDKVVVADTFVGDFVGTFMGELTTSGTVAATSFKIGEGCNLVYDTINKCVSFQFL